MTPPHPSLEQLGQGVRQAVRGLRKAPGFVAAVVLTLALGIGANAAMFSVVDRLIFRPYPHLRDPGNVHRVYFQTEDRGRVITRWDAEYTRYLDLARWTTAFAQTACFTHQRLAVGTGEAARERRVAAVSATFFDFFDARPALGRFFSAAEDVTPRGADVAVLSYDFWMTEFGGRDLVGEVLEVGDLRATVVGVAPRGFVGVDDSEPPALYLPITTFAAAHPDRARADAYFRTYSWRWMEIMVRRKPGVTPAMASADATQAYLRSWTVRGGMEPSLPRIEAAKPRAIVSAMRLAAGPDPGLEAPTALWMGAVAVIVLLIACANVTNLFLVRALGRQRDDAVRIAMGASWVRVRSSVLTESLVLAIAGAVAGLFVAEWAGAGIRRFLVGGEGAPPEILTDWRTVSAALGIAVAAALFTGAAVTMLSGRTELASSLRVARGGSVPHPRTRNALVVAQAGLSVALLIGAGLFVRSLGQVKTIPLGYDAEPVLYVSPALRGASLDEGARVAFRRALLAGAQSVPGVEHASWVSSVPFTGESSTRLFVAGIDSVERLGYFTYQAATTDYFATMGTPIVRGRGFSAEDLQDAPRIAVVSQSMGRVLWPDGDAIGQCLRIFADTAPCATVVGIAEDIVQRDVTAAAPLHYYVPIEQFAAVRGSALLLRMRGDPAVQSEAVRTALQPLLPGQSYVTIRPLQDLVEGSRRSWRLGATLFIVFGTLALTVAAIGLYAMIGYEVTQRRHELGVRLALGARSSDIVQLIVARGCAVVGVGVLSGFGVALGASRRLQPLLFQQSATDPVVYASVAALMFAVALAATTAPAVRASRSDPNSVLGTR